MLVEGLESRQLLNSHLPSASSVHVSALSVGVPAVIHGTANGTSSYTVDATNANTGTDSFDVSGQDSTGAVTVTGQDDYLEKLTHKNIYQDIYTNGSLTLTDADGTFAITYAGKGTQVGAGKFVENIQGTAVGTSGLVAGKYASFVGTFAGPGTTPETSFKYSLKFIAPPRSVSGSVALLTAYTTDPNNSNAGSDTYASTSGGKFSLTGQDTYTEVQQNATTYLDTYPSGTFTLTGKAGTYSINYVGTGKSLANGKFSLNIHGTATGTAGLVTGQVGTFTGSILGSYVLTQGQGKLTFKIQS